MKRLAILLFFSICMGSLGLAQTKNIRISFSPIFHQQALILGKTAELTQDSTEQISILKFYISKLSFYNGDSLLCSTDKSAFLLDASRPESLEINTEIPADIDFTSIAFNLGIDSLINVSGVYGGDLDPTKGMYWTWLRTEKVMILR